jgi:hydrogenase maturation factor HypF (carbamoyltransferase family)
MITPDGLTLKSEIDIGDTVLCDQCNTDYTNSEEKGGFIFGSHGVCPECAPGMMTSIKKYKEENYITSTCPEGMSFKEFIVLARGGNNTIKMYS